MGYPKFEQFCKPSGLGLVKYIYIYIKSKSSWEPTQVHTVSTFCEAVRKDIEQNQNKTKTSQNLTKGEKKALEDLGKRDDIIITKADKGGAVVILDVENYIKEAHRQLNDEQCYKRLNNDPTKHHAVKVH